MFDHSGIKKIAFTINFLLGLYFLSIGAVSLAQYFLASAPVPESRLARPYLFLGIGVTIYVASILVMMLWKIRPPNQAKKDALKEQARYLVKIGQVKKAKKILVYVLKHEPRDAGTHLALSRACFSLSRFDKALFHVNECLQIQPGNEDAISFKDNVVKMVKMKHPEKYLNLK